MRKPLQKEENMINLYKYGCENERGRGDKMNLLSGKQDIFSKEEINTQRQEEYDYLKGFFMVFIFGIHAFQATLTEPDLCMKILYGFATMSGAALFMFVMGMGSVYSKNSNAGSLAKNGVKMIAYQYLNNILYLIALAIPYPFVKNALSEQESEIFYLLMEIYVQYINIFFMTGVIYLLLALFKKLKMPIAGYAIIGFVSAISMFIIYFAGMLIGGKIAGISFALPEGVNIGNVIMSFVSKLFLSLVFVSIFVTMSLIGKQKTWLCLVLSLAVSMLLFMMISAIAPLDATFINVILSLVGGVLFATGLGIVGNTILKKTSLI